MGRGLDEQVIQLASIVRTGVEALPEQFECPICEEALSVREREDGLAGEFICSMWHVWSELLLHRSENTRAERMATIYRALRSDETVDRRRLEPNMFHLSATSASAVQGCQAR